MCRLTYSFILVSFITWDRLWFSLHQCSEWEGTIWGKTWRGEAPDMKCHCCLLTSCALKMHCTLIIRARDTWTSPGEHKIKVILTHRCVEWIYFYTGLCLSATPAPACSRIKMCVNKRQKQTNKWCEHKSIFDILNRIWCSQFSPCAVQ